MDHQNKVQFQFKWHHEGSAGIKKIECNCGYKGKFSGEDLFGVDHGDIWRCPKCNIAVEFVWYGMGWKPYIPPNEKHANIEELIYGKK